MTLLKSTFMSRRRKINMKRRSPAAQRLPREGRMEGKKQRGATTKRREKMVFECVTHTFNPISPGLQRLRAVGIWTSAQQRWAPPSRPVGQFFLLLFYIIVNLASAFIHSNLAAGCAHQLSATAGTVAFETNQSGGAVAAGGVTTSLHGCGWDSVLMFAGK